MISSLSHSKESDATRGRVEPGVVPARERELHEALRHCSPAVREAACDYWRTGDPTRLPCILHGIVLQHLGHDPTGPAPRLADELRLNEDLAIDSLSRMEIALQLEDVLRLELESDDLFCVGTMGDLLTLIRNRSAAICQEARRQS